MNGKVVAGALVLLVAAVATVLGITLLGVLLAGALVAGLLWAMGHNGRG